MYCVLTLFQCNIKLICIKHFLIDFVYFKGDVIISVNRCQLRAHVYTSYRYEMLPSLKSTPIHLKHNRLLPCIQGLQACKTVTYVICNLVNTVEEKLTDSIHVCVRVRVYTHILTRIYLFSLTRIRFSHKIILRELSHL